MTLKFTENYTFKLFAVQFIYNKLLFFPNKIQIINHVKLGTFKIFVGWTLHHFIRHVLFPYGQYLTKLNARCGARPKYNGLFQIQARPRSVLSEEKPRMKRCSIPRMPRKPVRGVTPPRTPRSPDEKLSPLTPVHPPNI